MDCSKQKNYGIKKEFFQHLLQGFLLDWSFELEQGGESPSPFCSALIASNKDVKADCPLVFEIQEGEERENESLPCFFRSVIGINAKSKKSSLTYQEQIEQEIKTYQSEKAPLFYETKLEQALDALPFIAKNVFLVLPYDLPIFSGFFSMQSAFYFRLVLSIDCAKPLNLFTLERLSALPFPFYLHSGGRPLSKKHQELIIAFLAEKKGFQKGGIGSDEKALFEELFFIERELQRVEEGDRDKECFLSLETLLATCSGKRDFPGFQYLQEKLEKIRGKKKITFSKREKSDRVFSYL